MTRRSLLASAAALCGVGVKTQAAVIPVKPSEVAALCRAFTGAKIEADDFAAEWQKICNGLALAA